MLFNFLRTTHQKNEHNQSIKIIEIFLLIAACLLPSLVNFSYGFGENIDSYLVLNRALRFGTEGYIKSRSWGVPIYEWIIYPFIYYFGITAGKLYSLLCLAITIYTASRYFENVYVNEKSRRILTVLGCAAVAYMPCTIISGNTLLETSQGACFGMIALFFYDRFFRKQLNFDLFYSYLFSTLAVATRPGYAIILISISIALILKRKVRVAQGIQIFFISLGIAAITYGLLYQNSITPPEWSSLIDFHIFSTGDPFWMRAIKTLIGFTAVLGIPAWLWIGITHTRALITQSKIYSIKNSIDYLFFIITPLYLMRMLILPDETEYIYFWAVVCLLWIFQKMKDPKISALLVICIALPNFFQLYFFKRAVTGEIQTHIGFTHGVFEQERQKRLLNEYIRTDFEKDSTIALKKLGCELDDIHAEDVFLERFPHEVTQDDRCVLTSLKWYIRMRDVVLPSQGITMQQFLSSYEHKLFIHTLRRDRGWRRFMKFYPAYPVHQLEFIEASNEGEPH